MINTSRQLKDKIKNLTDIVLDEIKCDTEYEIKDDEIDDEITEEPQSEHGFEMTML